MGRTRVSPEEVSYQVILSTGETDLSDSNSSTIASNGTPESNPRTTKIRFLDDLSPSEQQKYQDEQLKKQEERRAALAGQSASAELLSSSSTAEQQQRSAAPVQQATENAVAAASQLQNTSQTTGGSTQGSERPGIQENHGPSEVDRGHRPPQRSVEERVPNPANHQVGPRAGQPPKGEVEPAGLQRGSAHLLDQFRKQERAAREAASAHNGGGRWYTHRNVSDPPRRGDVHSYNRYSGDSQVYPKYSGYQNPVFDMDSTEDRYERWRSQRQPPGRVRRLDGHRTEAWRRLTVEQQIRYGVVVPLEQRVVSDIVISESRLYSEGTTIQTTAEGQPLVGDKTADFQQPQQPSDSQQLNGNIPTGVGEDRSGNPVEDENCNYDYSNVPMAGLPMIGAIMGMCLGGPVGFLAGVKIGGLAAVGGSILGYTGASVVSEHREIREYIDEHYQNKPELFVQSPREEAANKRRSSRQLPDIPRPLGSAASRCGPNGYRRPSLVRLTSQERYLSRSSSIEQRAMYRQSSFEGTHRQLPQRPPLSRVTSSEMRNIRNSMSAQRRGTYQRQSSAGRRLPRQASSEVHRALPNPRTFRRYGDQTDSEKQSMMALIGDQNFSDQSISRRVQGCDRQDPASDRRAGWSRASFQRSSSLETQAMDYARERRQTLRRQESVGGGSSSLPDLLEERSSNRTY